MEEEQQLKELGYYVIKTDDWDRYLWEVFADHELVYIAWCMEEAYCKLWELVEQNLVDHE